MGTKVNSNYEDLISFVRASGGGRATALRPVSYGDNELPSASFEVIGTGTWDSLAFVDTVGSQVRPGVTSQTSLTDGTTYALFINITDITGATQVRIDGLDGTDRLIGEGDHRISFTSNGGTPRIRLEDTSTSVNDGFTVQSAITAKEVTFDQPDGTLTLFPHPENVPRVEWDADRNRLGLLVEESRTNLITYSEDITDSAWARVGMSLVSEGADAIVAPDGTQTADTVTENNSTGTHYLAFTTNAVSANWTLSAFIKKKDDGVQVQLRPYGLGNNKAWATFDPANGSLLYSGGVALEGTSTTDVGNGWYRVSMTCNTALGSADGGMFAFVNGASGEFPSYTGQNRSFYIWGAQLEVGSFPTSYMKTSGNTASRSADVASIPVADFGFNTGAGTFVAEFDFTDPENDDSNYVAGGTASARIIYNNAGTSLWQTFDGNAAITFGELDNTGASRFKAAVGVKTGKDAVTVLDGDVKGSSTSATSLMTNLDNSPLISLGGGSDTQKLNGHIKSIKYYPRRLSDAQLVELTS
jgi:hypothetical protein